LISQRVPNTSTNYFIYDGHGSTRALTDNAGTVKNVFTYDAYGTLIASNTTAQTFYLYSGEQFDPDLGQYYLRARTYNPGTGRFWTMDTSEGNKNDPLSLHRYLYCKDGPIEGVDPSGHDEINALMDIGSFGLTLARIEGFHFLSTQEDDFTPNWKSGAGDVKHNNSLIEIKFPHGSASQIANQMYSDLQSFKYFSPNLASVRLSGNRAFFKTLLPASLAMNRLSPVEVAVQLVNGPGNNELSAVTLGHHMLVGVRRWRVKTLHESPPDLLVETEAYDQDNGYLNLAGREFMGYGQGKQYEVWHDYLNNIGKHWSQTAGATSSGETHMDAQDVGSQNPWRSQLPASLQ